MSHVLVLTLVYPPDSVSTAQIIGDLSADLATRGHEITVITTTPHYNRDPEAEKRQPLRRWWGPLVQRSEHGAATVFHTLMPGKGSSVAGRLAAWFLFHTLSLIVGTIGVRRVDAIVTPSPPLTMGVVAWLLGLWHRAPFIYNVQEIYPDIAINLGAVRNRMAIALLFRLERFVYARAAAITVIAERMRQRLLEKGVPPGKITVVPNFVDADALVAVPAPNAFTREHGLDGQCVVTYAGNLGPAQGLEALLDAAQRLAGMPGVAIVLIGGGTLWGTLAARIETEGLRNVRLIPFQPYSRMPEIYGASTLSVVMQAAATGSDAVPSKVYRIMACGRPVLAATDPDSDLAALVRTAGCGIVARQSDPGAIADAIVSACRDRSSLDVMGARGRQHVRAHYSHSHATGLYDTLLANVTVPRQPSKTRVTG